MRVNARLDDEAAEQIDYLTRASGQGVSHVVRESVAHYHVHVRAGRSGPARLLALLGKGDSSKAGRADGGIALWQPPLAQIARIPALMRRYATLPVDLADASLVLLAEHLANQGEGRILSTDERDFKTYRWKQRKPFRNLLAE